MIVKKVREAVNTHDQLVASGGGVALMKKYTSARDPRPWAWMLYGVDAQGKKIITGTDGHKLFSWLVPRRPKHEVRAEQLQAAKDYVAEKFGYRGKWVRNRMGDYIPEDVHKRFPLRKKP